MTSAAHLKRAQTAPDAEEVRRLNSQERPRLSAPAPSTTPTPKPAAALIARPLGYVLERLPSAVSGRVQPLYQSYAQPAVEKVDGVLFAVADRGSEILDGARAKIFKVKSRDNVSGMDKPGLGARVMAAAERAVDRVLPPPRLAERGAEADAPSETDSEDELSSLRRGLALLQVIRDRAYTQAEVKIIITKVKTRVWFDVHVARRYGKLVGMAKSLQSQSKARALRLKDACIGYEKRAETVVLGKYTIVKSRVGKHTAALTTRALALKKQVADTEKRAEAAVLGKYAIVKSRAGEHTAALTTRALALKKQVADRVRPYADVLKARVTPLANRLTAWAQKLREAGRKCVAYAGEKKKLIADKAKAAIAPVEEYAAAKYGATQSIAAKYTTRSIDYARANLEKVLGRDRSARLGGLLGRYATTVAQSVRAHAA